MHSYTTHWVVAPYRAVPYHTVPYRAVLCRAVSDICKVSTDIQKQ